MVIVLPSDAASWLRFCGVCQFFDDLDPLKERPDLP